MRRAQLKQDDLWSKWMDVAFSKLDSNGDGYISLGEIVDTVPGSDDANDIDNHLIAVSQAGAEPSLCHTHRLHTHGQVYSVHDNSNLRQSASPLSSLVSAH